MLSETKLSLLKELIKNASPEELIWSNGYLAGYLEKNGLDFSISTPVAQIAPIAIKPVIVYGTETGNAKKIASQLLTNFKKYKIQAKTVDILQFDLKKLEKESLVLFIVSTQGEGEFPQNALPFYDALQNTTTQFNRLKYAVLGLGDTSYPLFCNAGVLLDEALSLKGAQPLLPLTKADVDFAETVTQWETELQKQFEQLQSGAEPNATVKTITNTNHKQNYQGYISHKIVLNDTGSNKKTYHIEISSDDEVQYEPGDALGILPQNSTETIQEILDYFQEDGARSISFQNQTQSLEEILKRLNVKGLSKKSISNIAILLETNFEEEKADLIFLLKKTSKPENIKIEAFIELLLPIAPRLYSIASSPQAHEGQVHLTVNLNTFSTGTTIQTGLASQYLADFPLHTPFDFYIHKNSNFRLPSQDTDIILIGPGTGIAPFRSFLAHRDATGAEGKNWLFFGEQHFVLDFYYQTEIQDWLASGVINRLDTAFSRDQERKIYVQDRIKEKGKWVNEWLESGASLYICGQKNPMSHDVEQAILEVIATHRSLNLEQAKAVLEQLEAEGKYQKDVY